MRTPIVFENGQLYHIYNRGVDKRTVFTDSEDYLRFYQSLAYFNHVEPGTNFDCARVRFKKGNNQIVSIHAYALLPNHYHLLVEQLVDGGISEFVKRVSVGYTAYFNDKKDRSGVLFQGKFKRKHVSSDDYYNYLLAYINENYTVHQELNPTQAYQSSSLHYSGKIKSMLIDDSHCLTEYDAITAKRIAADIYKKRNEYNEIFIE